MYIFLQRKVKTCLDEAVCLKQRNNLHSDIVTQFEKLRGEEDDKIEMSFRESSQDKYDRLAMEYDTVRDLENAEKNYINQLIENPTDSKKWGEFAQFSLRYGLQSKAEQCIFRQIES